MRATVCASSVGGGMTATGYEPGRRQLFANKASKPTVADALRFGAALRLRGGSLGVVGPPGAIDQLGLSGQLVVRLKHGWLRHAGD